MAKPKVSVIIYILLAASTSGALGSCHYACNLRSYTEEFGRTDWCWSEFDCTGSDCGNPCTDCDDLCTELGLGDTNNLAYSTSGVCHYQCNLLSFLYWAYDRTDSCYVEFDCSGSDCLNFSSCTDCESVCNAVTQNQNIPVGTSEGCHYLCNQDFSLVDELYDRKDSCYVKFDCSGSDCVNPCTDCETVCTDLGQRNVISSTSGLCHYGCSLKPYWEQFNDRTDSCFVEFDCFGSECVNPCMECEGICASVRQNKLITDGETCNYQCYQSSYLDDESYDRKDSCMVQFDCTSSECVNPCTDCETVCTALGQNESFSDGDPGVCHYQCNLLGWMEESCPTCSRTDTCSVKFECSGSDCINSCSDCESVCEVVRQNKDMSDGIKATCKYRCELDSYLVDTYNRTDSCSVEFDCSGSDCVNMCTDCETVCATPSTEVPTKIPTEVPTEVPTIEPTEGLTEEPTEAPNEGEGSNGTHSSFKQYGSLRSTFVTSFILICVKLLT